VAKENKTPWRLCLFVSVPNASRAANMHPRTFARSYFDEYGGPYFTMGEHEKKFIMRNDLIAWGNREGIQIAQR
jgi:hypothetical protein